MFITKEIKVNEYYKYCILLAEITLYRRNPAFFSPSYDVLKISALRKALCDKAAYIYLGVVSLWQGDGILERGDGGAGD